MTSTNISIAEFKTIEGVLHVKYNNLFYINNEFLFLTINNDTILNEVKIIGGPEHSGQIKRAEYMFKPRIIVFRDIDELTDYVNTHNNLIFIKKIVNYFGHYYDHNVAHGLYDALYPSFLTLLSFFNENESYINLINVLYVNGWSFNGDASREYVLDIFNKFSGSSETLIKGKLNGIYKFDTFISGSEYAGISSVNKNGIMPGKPMFALEKFRNRMYQSYKIELSKKHNEINILILKSDRTSDFENNCLELINKELNRMGYNSKFISWKSIKTFKEQLEILSKIDIHISPAGTTMLNFPFLKDNSVHINLGVNKILPYKFPTLLEVNCCLASNNIYCDFYDIFTYKQILFKPLMSIIIDNIQNLQNNVIKYTKEPNFIKIWKELCIDFKDIQQLISAMNGENNLNLIPYRHIDMIVNQNEPYNSLTFQHNAFLNTIKNKYKTML